jgi:hypothetical protein
MLLKSLLFNLFINLLQIIPNQPKVKNFCDPVSIEHLISFSLNMQFSPYWVFRVDMVSL